MTVIHEELMVQLRPGMVWWLIPVITALRGRRTLIFRLTYAIRQLFTLKP